jgi:hypothetical protein
MELHHPPQQQPRSSGYPLTDPYSGNSPTWNISGVVYMPNANLTFSGAVNKSSNGLACTIFVVNRITVSGGGQIAANTADCAAANVTAPMSRGRLVN